MRIIADKLVCQALNCCWQGDYVAVLTLDYASVRTVKS